MRKASKADGRKNNGRKKGQTFKKADYILLFNQLHFKKPEKWTPQSYKSHPVCPQCKNDDGEKITRLRENFYECDLCRKCWDTELSPD